MIEALRLYAQFLKQFPISEEANVKLDVMLNNHNDTQFILFVATPHDNIGLRVIRRFRELGLYVQSEPTTDAMVKRINHPGTHDYAFSFVPDITRIGEDRHTKNMGVAFANAVMRKLPRSLLK